MNLTLGKKLSAILLLVASTHVFANGYQAPSANQSLIGQVQYTTTGPSDTVVTIAQQYDLGFNAIEKANPHLNMAKGFPRNSLLVVPTQHLLPNQPREGIVVNLPEMRMYYYPAGSNKVFTYPIGIGKMGKTIPIRKAVITRKKMNPIWIPPEDIREFVLKEQHVVLPRIMQPGPDNPLGPYGIYMSIPTYLIHSTIFPESIGRRASFGCIRMYESDVKGLYPSMTHGIPVVIVDSPTKIGWQDDHLYMETHRPLEEHSNAFDAGLPGMVHMVEETTSKQPMLVDWQLISYMSKERDGIPHEVGMKIQHS